MSPSQTLHLQEPWDEAISSDCFFVDDCVFQRDFCARRRADGATDLMAPYELDDGLFNFLRYFLPVHLLDQKKVIFHSSCAVDDEEEAYLFFGFSGAGKTTISKMCGAERVLGDDMNLLTVTDGKLFVEPALIGQQIYHKRFFDRRFPVKKAFWISQEEKLRLAPLVENRKGRILSSFSGLFWDRLGAADIEKVFSLLAAIEKSAPFFELGFSLQSEVWDVVRK